MPPSNILKSLFSFLFAASYCLATTSMNVVFVTIDDLNRDSLGIHGSTVANISPHLDALALSGLRFNHAHVSAANCTPSRNVMVSGKYPHNNKVLSVSNEGSGNQTSSPMLPDIFRAAGYHTGIMGKNSHMLPFHPYYGWDAEYDSYGSTRDPDNIYDKLSAAITDAETAGKPLFFNLNIYDPHVSWHNWDHKAGEPKVTGDPAPSTLYTGADVPYPSYMPALTAAEMEFEGTDYDVMDEIAAYYNSVKRADDSIGRMMDALNDAEIADNTIVIVISDHGAELPGSKTQLYHHSSVSPMFVVWPGTTTAATIDDTHMINSVDFLPSFCELIGQPIPADVDGRSFIPILQGQTPTNWPEYIYKEHSVGHNMRAVETTNLLYIFNPWSDGSRNPSSVTKNHKCFEAIELAAAGGNTVAAAWLQKFEYRTVEELYDTANDPDCANNLLEFDPTANEFVLIPSATVNATQLAEMRTYMTTVMEKSGDTEILTAFNNRNSDEDALDNYMSGDAAMRAGLDESAEHARDVFFNPHDDWVKLDYTIFEPFGNWGGWQAGDSGINLNATEGESKTSGSSAIEFNGDVANSTRLLFSKTLDTSALETLKLDVIFNDDDTAFSGGATLSLQYDDGSGAGWQTFQTITSTGSKNIEMELPSGGLPASMDFSILADLNGTSGSIYMDYARFTAWQDWVSIPTDAPFDATNLRTVRLAFNFETSNFTDTDKLLLEYYDGSQWILLKEYDFCYAPLQTGELYSDNIDLEHEIYTFPDNLEFRFRSDSTASGQSYVLSNYTIQARALSDNGPKAVDDSYSTTEPVAVIVAAPGVLANDSTGSGSAIHAELVSDVSHGILEFNSDGSFVYAAINGHVGEDSFTYKAVNEEDSHAATVTLTINSASVTPSGELPFSDDFETADASGGSGTAPGWVDEGATWITTGDGVDGSIGIRMRSGNSLMTKPLDTSGYTDISITFQGKSENLSSGEEMVLQWSADGSTNWQTVGTVPHTVTAYQEFNFDFPEGAENNPNFALRFQGNSGANTERGYFDNVVVTGTPMSADPIASFSEWATTHGVAETDDALLDYAFNINPHLSTRYAMSGNSGLPLWDFSETNSDLLTIRYLRRKQASDISYTVQFVSDLTGTWQDAITTETVTPINDEFEQVTIPDHSTMANEAKRFARVQIQILP